jgi:hypothetical protein
MTKKMPCWIWNEQKLQRASSLRKLPLTWELQEQVEKMMQSEC